MREKLYNLFNKLYGITMTVAFFAGIVPLVLFVVAMIIGGSAGETIAVFLYKQVYPWVIALASVSILFGLIAMYIKKEKGLSVDSNKK